MAAAHNHNCLPTNMYCNTIPHTHTHTHLEISTWRALVLRLGWGGRERLPRGKSVWFITNWWTQSHAMPARHSPVADEWAWPTARDLSARQRVEWVQLRTQGHPSRRSSPLALLSNWFIQAFPLNNLRHNRIYYAPSGCGITLTWPADGAQCKGKKWTIKGEKGRRKLG